MFLPHPVCQGLLGVWSVTSYLLRLILRCWDLLGELWLRKLVGRCSGSIKPRIFLHQKIQQLALYGGLWVTVSLLCFSVFLMGNVDFLYIKEKIRCFFRKGKNMLKVPVW